MILRDFITFITFVNFLLTELTTNISPTHCQLPTTQGDSPSMLISFSLLKPIPTTLQYFLPTMTSTKKTFNYKTNCKTIWTTYSTHAKLKSMAPKQVISNSPSAGSLFLPPITFNHPISDHTSDYWSEIPQSSVWQKTHLGPHLKIYAKEIISI